MKGCSIRLARSRPAWRASAARIRAFHTDYYFAYNLPLSLFDEIVHEVVQSKHTQTELMLAFNPEIAPWEMLFRQGEIYEIRRRLNVKK